MNFRNWLLQVEGNGLDNVKRAAQMAVSTRKDVADAVNKAASTALANKNTDVDDAASVAKFADKVNKSNNKNKMTPQPMMANMKKK